MLGNEFVSWRVTHHSQPQSSARLVSNSSIRSFGLRLLGFWLLLHGLIDLFELSFQYQGLLLTLLALVAGGLLIIGS